MHLDECYRLVVFAAFRVRTSQKQHRAAAQISEDRQEIAVFPQGWLAPASRREFPFGDVQKFI